MSVALKFMNTWEPNINPRFLCDSSVIVIKNFSDPQLIIK